jgi:hypothetical protein
MINIDRCIRTSLALLCWVDILIICMVYHAKLIEN